MFNVQSTRFRYIEYLYKLCLKLELCFHAAKTSSSVGSCEQTYNSTREKGLPKDNRVRKHSYQHQHKLQPTELLNHQEEQVRSPRIRTHTLAQSYTHVFGWTDVFVGVVNQQRQHRVISAGEQWESNHQEWGEEGKVFLAASTRPKLVQRVILSGSSSSDSGGAESECRPQGRDRDAARQTSRPPTQISRCRLWDGRKRNSNKRSRPREEKSGRLQLISRLGQQQSVKAKERGRVKETDWLAEVKKS